VAILADFAGDFDLLRRPDAAHQGVAHPKKLDLNLKTKSRSASH
jgi:hypothetical protein